VGHLTSLEGSAQRNYESARCLRVSVCTWSVAGAGQQRADPV